MSSLLNTTRCSTVSVVCPHCGYHHEPSPYFGTSTYHCQDCGQLFALLVETVTTYKTKAMEPSNVYADDPDEVCEVCDHAGHNVKCCVDCTNHCNFTELPQ